MEIWFYLEYIQIFGHVRKNLGGISVNSVPNYLT